MTLHIEIPVSADDYHDEYENFARLLEEYHSDKGTEHAPTQRQFCKWLSKIDDEELAREYHNLTNCEWELLTAIYFHQVALADVEPSSVGDIPRQWKKH